MMCESKQQICYSKKITNDAGEYSQTDTSSLSMIFFLPRKTSTVQSGLLSTSINDGQQFSMSPDQSRRKNHLHEILPGQSMQQRGSKVRCERRVRLILTYFSFFFSDGAPTITINRLTFVVYYLLALLVVIISPLNRC